MTQQISQTMHALCTLLEKENEALASGKITEAVALLPEKQQLANLFDEQYQHCKSQNKLAVPDHSGLSLIEASMQRNEELLRLAITTQQRVVSLLAETAATGLSLHTYGQEGVYAASGRDDRTVFTQRA